MKLVSRTAAPVPFTVGDEAKAASLSAARLLAGLRARGVEQQFRGAFEGVLRR